eukprot:360381-Chlamydomonas_euryale.AAC.1
MELRKMPRPTASRPPSAARRATGPGCSCALLQLCPAGRLRQRPVEVLLWCLGGRKGGRHSAPRRTCHPEAARVRLGCRADGAAPMLPKSPFLWRPGRRLASGRVDVCTVGSATTVRRSDGPPSDRLEMGGWA